MASRSLGTQKVIYQVAFTVGSAQAGGVNGIDPYVIYNTYIIARQGTANQDNAFINVQLGICDPSFQERSRKIFWC